MHALLRFADSIDRLSTRLGALTGWLVLAMIGLGAFNAVARYLGRYLGTNLSSNALVEAQWYLFALVFLFGASAALSQDAHVRVDVLYGRLDARKKAALDLVGAVLLLLPFCVFGVVICLPSVATSWQVFEGSPDPGGLPRYPIKTAVPLAFAWLGVQGLANAARQLATLRGVGPTVGEAS